MSDNLQALDASLKGAHSRLEDADEVVVGAVRGLLECARFGDSEAESILRKISYTDGANDSALRDALDLFQDRLEAYRRISAEVRNAISRQEG